MRRTFRIDSANKSKQDVEREIALHLELRAREFEAAGMSRDARARPRARPSVTTSKWSLWCRKSTIAP